MDTELTKGMLSVRQAAQVLGVSTGTIYALCARGPLDHYRIGTRRGAIRIALPDLLAYLERSRHLAGEKPLQPEHIRYLSRQFQAAAIRPFRHIRPPPPANQE